MESRKLIVETNAKIQADLEIQKTQMDSNIEETNLEAQEATLKLKDRPRRGEIKTWVTSIFFK